ncbi:hypothetical protein [Urbifossiella limnaea]|uniref:Uncharacterized protein n=1 Tax=Urbifossiella limnaea TaxID=2528023 RepID=A0A517XU53_9BACT|nr:hypothetical protein [Urbifossiella limnaea]QDU21036.1 hypothetical protein ETAA1_29990 [Urbifossiella limnaea]
MTQTPPPPPSGIDRTGQPPPPDVLTLHRRLPPAGRFTRALGDQWTTVGDPLTEDWLRAHVRGVQIIGAYPAADGVARFGVIDIDHHPADGVVDPAAVRANEAYARAKHAELMSMGIVAVLVRGHTAGSLHLWLSVQPMDAARLGRWLQRFVADRGDVPVDTFPSRTGGGNAVRLPGRHHRHPDQWSAHWNAAAATWEPWPAAWEALAAIPDNDQAIHGVRLTDSG